MTYDNPLALLHPSDLQTEKAFVLTSARWRLLVQGDSWFSIGQLPPWPTGNLLNHIRLPASATGVSFAAPGKTFAQMVQWHQEPSFVAVLAGGTLAYEWDAIVMSAGGNDLFSAILTPPDEKDPTKAALRLLLTQTERQPQGDVSRYVRRDGLSNFFSTIIECFVALISKRDAEGSRSKGIPIFIHTYDCPQPRWAPITPWIGPWLAKAFEMYGIAESDWLLLARYFINQWTQFLSSVNAMLQHTRGIPRPAVSVVNLVGTLQPADPDTKGASADWENEIHPTSHGYAKLGVVFEKQLALGSVSAAPAESEQGFSIPTARAA